jgi:hypothetical protein
MPPSFAFPPFAHYECVQATLRERYGFLRGHVLYHFEKKAIFRSF